MCGFPVDDVILTGSKLWPFYVICSQQIEILPQMFYVTYSYLVIKQMDAFRSILGKWVGFKITAKIRRG